MKLLFIVIAISALLPSCAVRLIAAVADPAPQRNVYDYSSPQGSFQSFQKAIRADDLEGTLIHYWHIGRATSGATGSDTNKTFASLVESSRQEKSPFLKLDTFGLGAKIKFTDAVFLKEISREHQTGYGGYSLCRFLVEWPSARKRAYLHACKFDGSGDWWFLETWGYGYGIDVFDAGNEEKD